MINVNGVLRNGIQFSRHTCRFVVSQHVSVDKCFHEQLEYHLTKVLILNIYHIVHQTWGTLQQCRCTTGQPYTTFVGSNVVYPTLPPYCSLQGCLQGTIQLLTQCCVPYIATLLQFTCCLQGTLLQSSVGIKPTFVTTFWNSCFINFQASFRLAVLETARGRIRASSYRSKASLHGLLPDTAFCLGIFL